MTEMIRRFLRQKFGSPGVAIALAVLALLTAFPLALSGGQGGLEVGFFALVLLAAASISKDASSGALQMILARPIRRTEYLFGRYLGVLTAYALFLAVCAGLALALALGLLPLLGAPVSVSPLALLRSAAAALLSGALFAAVLLFFGTFLPGYGDVLGYVLLMLGLGLPSALSGVLRNPWLDRVGEVAKKNVLPEVRWQEVLQGASPLGEPTGRWVLAMTVFLLAAAVIFSRREFAYGQD